MQFPNPNNNNEDLLSSLSSKNKAKRNGGSRKSSHTVDDGTVSSKHSASTAKSDSSKATEKSRKSLKKVEEDPFLSSFNNPTAMFSGTEFFDDNNAFANFPSANQALTTKTATSADNAADFGQFNGFEAFDQNAFFSQPDEPVFDTTPHANVPKDEPDGVPNINPKLSISQRLRRTFLTNPVNDTASGNYLIAVERPDASIWIESIDSESSHDLRSAFPLLASNLRRRVATKYKSTLTKIHKVWCMATGSQQVAVLLDAKTLGSSSLRLIVVYHIPTGRAEYVLTPPSGGDFVYNIATLAISRKLIFLAGASPKGACVFLCRPSLRESWSANFLSGPGYQVTALSAATHKPWLVIGLTDQSVTVWTYSTSTSSKRWLLPLCRLDGGEKVGDAAKSIAIPGVQSETGRSNCMIVQRCICVLCVRAHSKIACGQTKKWRLALLRTFPGINLIARLCPCSLLHLKMRLPFTPFSFLSSQQTVVSNLLSHPHLQQWLLLHQCSSRLGR